MNKKHKSKAITSLIASVSGSIGLHRFYLAGRSDTWGWLHLISLPISILLAKLFFNLPLILTMSPFILSVLSALLEALVIGLMSDEKWDARHNPDSGRHSESTWPLAISLVLTAGIGAMMLIAILARTFDLLYTGGSYG
jgi:TM2 domain-containing membrane protein YozV